MFSDTYTNTEHYPNGQLRYVETIAVLPNPLPLSFIPGGYYIINIEGKDCIRIGRCAKYHDNGIVAWEMDYDNTGRVKKGSYTSRRRDGSFIQY